MIDSHCLLDWKDFDGDLDIVIRNAIDAGVKQLIHIGLLPGGIGRAVEIVEAYPNVFGAIGCHPHDAEKWTDEFLDTLEDNLSHPKLLAVGEIGLDYFKGYSPKDKQISAFRKQLRLAQKLKLPVIIHCRDAYSDTHRIMKEELGDEIKGVLHCFSGNIDDAKMFIDFGMNVSFAGHLTYKKNNELREVAKYVPEETILIETDAPFLAPQSHRGKRNEPAFVKETLELISKIRRIPFKEIELQTEINTHALFNFS